MIFIVIAASSVILIYRKMFVICGSFIIFGGAVNTT